MNTARGGGLRQRRQLWLDRLPRYAEYCGQAQERRLAHARVSARESESITREQSTRRRAATRNVQLVGATNARPCQRPAFWSSLHFESAASCAVRFPNVDRIRPSPPPLRANVCRPVLICGLARLNPSRSSSLRCRWLPESMNLAASRRQL